MLEFFQAWKFFCETKNFFSRLEIFLTQNFLTVGFFQRGDLARPSRQRGQGGLVQPGPGSAREGPEEVLGVQNGKIGPKTGFWCQNAIFGGSGPLLAEKPIFRVREVPGGKKCHFFDDFTSIYV